MTMIWALVIANVLFLIVGGRHFLSGTDLKAYADASNLQTQILPARRGSIIDRNGNVLAQDNPAYNIICVLQEGRMNSAGEPAYVVDKEKTAELLSRVLDIKEENILALLNKKDLYQTELGIKGRNLTSDQKKVIESYELPGIEFEESFTRYYPGRSLAAHLIGYTSQEDGLITGTMGIEKNYNKELKGIDGMYSFQQDAKGYMLPGSRYTQKQPKNGDIVQLTIDSSLQEALEVMLAAYSDKLNADGVWGGVINVKSGEILAWGQHEGFDLNNPIAKNYNNIGIELPYEVGSTVKPFTYAAALDSNKDFNMDLTFKSGPFLVGNLKNGYITRASSSSGSTDRIRNFRGFNYGKINFWDGMCYSANTAIATILSKYLKTETLEKYFLRFGFFQEVDTDRFSDNPGKLTFKYPSEMITTGYGQGSTFTMLQLFQAYTALFNGGKMVKPYFVKSLIDSSNNKPFYEAKTEIIGQPISEETAKTILEAMRNNVESPKSGSAYRYKIKETTIVAKTGTADLVEKGEYGKSVIVSIVIGMPADDPVVLVYYAAKTKQMNQHEYNSLMRVFLKKIVMTLDLSDGGKKLPVAEGEEQLPYSDTGYMPNLVNHSLNYGKNYLKTLNITPLVIGNGATIVNQYPQEGLLVNKLQKVFLLSDANKKLIMPDMTGWTRKEINGYFSLLDGYSVNIEGSGVVYAQSVEAGRSITEKTEIDLFLK